MGKRNKNVGLFSLLEAFAKPVSKPKRRKTGGRGFSKKDYWPHNKRTTKKHRRNGRGLFVL